MRPRLKHLKCDHDWNI